MVIKITKVSYYDKKEGRLQISLCGKWLQYCGFSKGDKVKIESIKEGELKILKVK